MKLFADAGFKNEIKSINFGIVDAGTCKELSVFIYNDLEAMMTNLRFKIPPIEGLEIIQSPITIQSKKGEKFTLKWCPTMKFKKALIVTLEISGDEVYLAPISA